MQRNRSRQTAFIAFIGLVTYLGYVSLSSMYLLLPPLFGWLFVRFTSALDHNHFGSVLLTALLLVLYEVEKGYLLISSIVFFGLIYQFAIPKLRQYIDCSWCLKLIYIIIAYLGFWVFSLILSKVFWMDAPTIDWHVIFYILIEFILVMLL